MEKEQEILAVSRLAFELTRLGGVDGDLDRLLERLHALLGDLPSLAVRPSSVLLLNNPRQHLVQVAQFGLQPAWGKQGPVGRLASLPDALDHAFVSSPGAHRPPLDIEGIAANAPCFVLPLVDDGAQLGRLLLFIEPGWQPDAVEIEFMTDLSRTLSLLVARCLINETLRVREVELEDARTDAIRRLGAASEYRDNETGMHVMRMTHYATAIAKAMGLPEEQRELLGICAPMHDVGKIGISDAILLKPGRLTGDEFEVMKTHTEIGRRLLDGNDALISAARDIAGCHHERWDGAGYPNALAGEEIPILARICAIADVLDALTSVRPYKNPWPFDEAVAFIQRESGGQFDPAVVTAFEHAMPEILRIRELYRDDIIDPRQVVTLPETVYREDGWVAWTSDSSIGIDVIDEHHRYLFELTNELFEVVEQKRGAREVARILKALDQYAQVHFRAEERMMAHYSYDRLDRQEHQHHRFETRLREFYGELHDNPLTTQFEVLVFLREWLLNHIRNEDAQLRELIAAVA